MHGSTKDKAFRFAKVKIQKHTALVTIGVGTEVNGVPAPPPGTF